MLSLGVATRISVLPGLIAVIALSVYRTRKITNGLICVLIAGITLLGICLPFYQLSPDTFFYDIWGYHFDKESFGFARQIMHRINAVVMLSRLYFIVMFGCVIIGLEKWSTPHRKTSKHKTNIQDGAWIVGLIILGHFTSQAPYIHRYMTMLIPAVAAVLAPELVKMERRLIFHRFSGAWGWVFVLSCIMTLVSRGAENINTNQGGAYAYLMEVSDYVAKSTPEDKPILTFNNSVAVEAGRRTLDGDEMNVLTYHPLWDEKRCHQFKIMNVEMLKRQIQDQALGGILVTKYSFLGNFPTFYNPGERGARPVIMSAIKDRYMKIKTFPQFGYLGECADFYVPNPSVPNSKTPFIQFEHSLIR